MYHTHAQETPYMKKKERSQKANHLATNRNQVIQLIRQESFTDRSKISSMLDINVSTSKRIVDELAADGIVIYLGAKESTGGRKAAKIGINPDYGYNIAVKIEVDKLIFALTDFASEIVDRKIVPFPKGSSFAGIKDVIKQNVIGYLMKANADGKKIYSIGFAVSGVASKDATTLVGSRLLGWSQIDFKKEIENELKLPVFVENDVNCAAIAEQWFGLGKGLDTFLLVTIGEGTGAGIIINKKLYKGTFGGAGEIGHSIFERDGIPCYCGQKGCFEMYTNESYLTSRIADAYPQVKKLSPEVIAELVKKDKKGIMPILDDFAKNLASGLIGPIMLLEPERVIIGGELDYVMDYVKGTVQTIVHNNWINKLNDGNDIVDVAKSTLGGDAFLRGLSVLLVSRVLYTKK
jgi:N-acetylglucosamine repressor